MYYKLSSKYLLRGWNLLPYAIIDTSNGKICFLNKDSMEAAKLCNGKIDFDLPIFSDQIRTIINELVKCGYVEKSEKVSPINQVQEYKKHNNRFIRQAHWSITGKCNYKCRHCIMSAPEAKMGELPHHEIMKMIDELAECGIYSVSLTGGEPLVRSDFWEIIDALKEHNIYIESIYSNGFLVNEELLKGLKDRGFYPEFNMSFDGTDGWHDWMRGIPYASKYVDRAFKLCREYGFSTSAEMCIHKKNQHTLRDSINYLASLGCREVKTNPVTNLGEWFEGGYGTSIETKDLLEVYLDYIPKFYEDGKPMTVLLGGFFYGRPDTNNYQIPLCKNDCLDMNKVTVCGHARNVMYISPEGRALPCFSLSSMEIQNKYPSIFEKGLKYCLTESSYMQLIETPVSKVIEHNEKCRQCTYSKYCRGGCRAAALENDPNDILSTDEATCMMFKGGYIERLIDTISKCNPNAVCTSYIEHIDNK